MSICLLGADVSYSANSFNTGCQVVTRCQAPDVAANLCCTGTATSDVIPSPESPISFYCLSECCSQQQGCSMEAGTEKSSLLSLEKQWHRTVWLGLHQSRPCHCRSSSSILNLVCFQCSLLCLDSCSRTRCFDSKKLC